MHANVVVLRVHIRTAKRSCCAMACEPFLRKKPWNVRNLYLQAQAYVVGPNFKGAKMVPPGAHFVSSNAVSSGQSAAAAGGGSDVAPTASFFAELALRQVLVRRWDSQEELLLPLEDVDEVRQRHSDDMCLSCAEGK